MGWHKYKASKTTINGISFPSKLEAAVYSQYHIIEGSGQITNLRCQASVVVKEKCKECGDGPITWKVDFSFIEDGKVCYAEAKGVETSDYIKRKRLWKKNPPGKLYIWKGSYKYPKLAEIIE